MKENYPTGNGKKFREINRVLTPSLRIAGAMSMQGMERALSNEKYTGARNNWINGD
jgi:hypothetical protein